MLEQSRIHQNEVMRKMELELEKNEEVKEILTTHKPLSPIDEIPNFDKSDNSKREKRIPIYKLRQTVAKRLKDAQNTAAILTTFNEIDMTEVMNIRKKEQKIFS